MTKLMEKAMPRSTAYQPLAPLRSIRPSLLDVRFTGDPWVVVDEDGTASVRLDNYRLAGIQTLPYDVPTLNQLLWQLRQWQVRRCLYRQLRARRQARSTSDGLLKPVAGASGLSDNRLHPIQ